MNPNRQAFVSQISGTGRIGPQFKLTGVTRAPDLGDDPIFKEGLQSYSPHWA
jgi:hypothetical protein